MTAPKVPVLLWVGVAVLPIVFSWAVIAGRGYSSKAKGVALVALIAEGALMFSGISGELQQLGTLRQYL